MADSRILYLTQGIIENSIASGIPYGETNLKGKCAHCGFIPQANEPISVLVSPGDRLDFMAAIGLLLAKEEVAQEVVKRFPEVSTREVYEENRRGRTGRLLKGYVQLLFELQEYDPTLWPYQDLTRCPVCGNWQGTPAIAVKGGSTPFPMPLVRGKALGGQEIFLLGHRYRLLATGEAKQWFVERNYTGLRFMAFGTVVE
jgi:hypothetical protein